MSMRLYSCLITVALLCYPYVALGDAHSHRKAAETLLIVMEVDKSLPQITAQVVETQLQQNPQLAPQREVLQRFLSKYLNWESVKEDTITAYTQEFTEPELKKLTEFYKTPVGKKANEKMPQLAFISGQIGLKKAQAQSSGTAADARRPAKQTGGRRLTVRAWSSRDPMLPYHAAAPAVTTVETQTRFHHGLSPRSAPIVTRATAWR